MMATNRAIWDGIPEGLDGDRTATGSYAISSLPNFNTEGIGALRHGDKTTPCPVCGQVGELIGNIPFVILHGRCAAGNNAVVTCGCPPGSNRLISPAGPVGRSRPQSTRIVSQPQPIQFAQTVKAPPQTSPSPKPVTAPPKKSHTPVDAGYCILPYGVTAKGYESWLFNDELIPGTKALYHSLNGSEEYKAGSLLLIVDPEKQDDRQISHMKAAKTRVDAALAPLSHQQARFLHKNRDVLAMAAAALDASGTGRDAAGSIAEAAKGYFERIGQLLLQIQTTYQNAYITQGALIGEEFYVQRRQLLAQLDSVLKAFMNKRFMFNQYESLKTSLGLSTHAITHQWNETGVGDIENYATHIEKAAKIVKTMEVFGRVGIGLNALNAAGKIYDACTTGRDCEKTTFTSMGEFAGGLAGGIVATKILTSEIADAGCAVVLGALSIEAGGVLALTCSLTVTGTAAYKGDKLFGAIGEWAGEKISEQIVNE
ncbi:PAAR domain-containing protein [Pseudescherichia vulneris]|uniref:PAAR domain-containing protein n=1 Tax=Pseudescherichia vulneris TaxID=566 RepID=UPI00227B7070|nr:PAAR domain-containing protein [Pseudescherichia vulneris]WAH51869.1 PAAR domain-containing protein [Pseudescherichia vulneris]